MKSLSPASFNNRTLGDAVWGKAVCRILHTAIQAVDPYEIVAGSLSRKGEHLRIGQMDYDLTHSGRVMVLALGKASAPMTIAAADILGEYMHSGLVIVKPGYDRDITFPQSIQLVKANHPLPGPGSMEAGKFATDLAASMDKDDLLLCMISGGGSALCVSPAPPITLEDLQTLNDALLASGANISEINTVRKHLETLKGGGLARTAAPGRIANLILSDVIGDSIDEIASGITAADHSTFIDALQVLRKYQLAEESHPKIFKHLYRGASGEIEETPKPSDPIFDRVQSLVIGSNLLAAQAALETAKVEGFNTMLLTTHLQGEARQAGRFLASIAQQMHATDQPLPRPACLVAGGETTVTVTGNGRGGRNLELALAAVPELAGLNNIALVTLATDGGDGPTDAAGAIVSGETLSRALELGMNPEAYLLRNDSYHFFQALGDLIKPGPTMTNVNDLSFLYAF